MIKVLNIQDKQQVFDFCYQREKENIFVIGSFNNYEDTFKSNNFYGYSKDDQLIGLGVFFSRFRNLVINAQDKEVIEDIAVFATGKRLNEITKADRERVFYQQEFVLRENNKIISKANIHGRSENYFQIGGVGTLETHRCKGYAKQIVSKLCEHFFKQGVKYELLFTRNDNYSAQKLYNAIGFKPIDKFVIAEY